MEDYKIRILYATAIVVAVSLAVKLFERTHLEGQQNYKNAVKLLKKAIAWHSMSLQDTHSEIAYQHINYAIAYLGAARECASDTILEHGCRCDVHHFSKAVHQRQQSLIPKVTCTRRP